MEKVIILHPDVENIKSEVEKLRTELSMLVLERDNLLYHECKEIETAYLLSVGALEYKAFEIECAILRTKRKIDLIQAKKNRQEKIILSEIDDQLDFEFEDYMEKLEEHMAKMNDALYRSKNKLLSEKDSRELKKLYRTIVKALHPDLNPDLSEEKQLLFHQAVFAYECGDVEGLRIISTMVSDPTPFYETTDSFKAMQREKERIAELLLHVKEKIESIKTEYPYTLKDIIQTPGKLDAIKTELENHISQMNEVLSEYKSKIEGMLR